MLLYVPHLLNLSFTNLNMSRTFLLVSYPLCALLYFFTPKKKKKKKIPPKKGKRESERVITFLCGNICIELERKYQIYSKSMGIRRAKIKGRGRDKIDIIVESSGEMKR